MTRARFTQQDVTRAVKGAQCAGLQLDEVIITPTGEICMMTRKAAEFGDTPSDVQAELGRHFSETKI